MYDGLSVSGSEVLNVINPNSMFFVYADALFGNQYYHLTYYLYDIKVYAIVVNLFRQK